MLEHGFEAVSLPNDALPPVSLSLSEAQVGERKMCEILCDSIKDHARNFEKVRRVILELNVAAFVFVHLFEE